MVRRDRVGRRRSAMLCRRVPRRQPRVPHPRHLSRERLDSVAPPASPAVESTPPSNWAAPTAPVVADRADRRALRTLQLGALAVVLAASPYKLFELDRFFVPKELVLHLTAALAIWWTVGRRRPDPEPARWRPTAVDLALAAYLALSVVSAALAANRWLAARALAISVSGGAIFWAGRALARRGLGRQLLATAAGATALAAATSLLQAYGVESEYFSLNRAPGGTFGNRNFVAHLAAIGMPLLVGLSLRARAGRGALAAAVGAGALATVLVLSRSRGAWLAAAAAAAPLAVGFWRARRLPGVRPRPGRAALLAVVVSGGVAAALFLPNTL